LKFTQIRKTNSQVSGQTETTEETAEQKWPKESEEARKQAEQAIHEQRCDQSLLSTVHVGQTAPKVRSQEHT